METQARAVSFATRLPFAGFAAIVCLLPMLAVPFIDTPLDLQKSQAAAGALGLALCSLSLLIFFGKALPLPRHVASLGGIPLLLVAILSALSAAAPNASWWGHGFEMGTIGSLLVFSFAVLAGALVPRHLLPSLLVLFVCGVFFALLHALLGILSGSSGAVTLAGGWPQLSFFVSAAAVACAIAADEMAGPIRTAAIFLLAVFAGGLLVLFQVGAAMAALLTLVISLAVGVKGEHSRFVGRAACALLLAAALVLGMRGPLVDVVPDIRPSLYLSEQIAMPVLAETVMTTVAGKGPGTFAYIWEESRTPELNLAPYWSVSFSSAYSTLITRAVELGTVGLAAFLLWPALLLLLARTSPAGARGPREQALRRIFLALSLFFFLACALYTLEIAGFLMGGLMLGVLAALTSPTVSYLSRPVSRFAAAIVIGILGAFVLYVGAMQAYSSFHHSRGAALLEQDPVLAAASFAEAADAYGSSRHERDAARAFLAAALAQVQEGTEPTEAFVEQVDRSIERIERAVVVEPRDWESWFERASIYFAILPPSGEERAEFISRIEESLAHARTRAPARPEVPYLAALVAQARGDLQAARAQLNESLRLKADYGPAVQLGEELGTL